jgi:predicted nucleotide-binding protein (sugar kinase/HSP70/actin superfamily)
VNPGQTDRVLEESMELLHDVMRRRRPWTLTAKSRNLLEKLGLAGTGEYLGKFLNQILGGDLIAALREVRDRFAAIPVDRTRVKPIVKITGEFWAQTTEGDGNFNMFRFLEKEGAQVVVEPIGTWICYLMHQVVQRVRDHKGLSEGAVLPPKWRLDKHLKINLAMYKKILQLKIGEAIFKREYNRIIDALGGIAHHLVDQYELQRLGHPYYNSRAAGGEGHLEVAKNIYYSHKGLAHMVLALKPFGCMPSTQSDGAQSAVMSHYKDMIFLPIETSGEGDVNANSRVQMALGEAKAKTKLEFKAALDSTGRTVEEIRAYLEEHPALQSPMDKVPRTQGVVGGAAQFVLHVAKLMKAEGWRPRRSSAAA